LLNSFLFIILIAPVWTRRIYKNEI